MNKTVLMSFRPHQGIFNLTESSDQGALVFGTHAFPSPLGDYLI